MIKITKIIIFSLCLISCSVYDTTGFWSKQKQIDKENLQFKKIFDEKEFQEIELNPSILINVEFENVKKNLDINFNNNDGYVNFNGEINNVSKFKFSKIKNFKKIEPNLILNNNNVIFFDDKGNLLCFDQNSNLVWKQNIYTKEEIKIGPLLSLHKKNDKLIVTDNLARIYSLDIDTGDLIWEKRHNSPFNSEIKTYKNRIYVVDSNNTLNSFLLKDGSKVWSHITEKSFINSLKRLSLVIINDKVIFNNSLGDITAVNAKDGKLIWQTVTFNSNMFEDIMSLKTSDLVIDENNLYFSNNKNEFYSVDSETGLINWKQQISSNLKPTIIESLIFTFSNTGYQYVVEKNSGNIIRVNDVFYQFKEKKRKKISPIGFIMNTKEIFLSTSIGKLLIVNWSDGRVKNTINIAKDYISRPYVDNKIMYLIKDNSIIKLN